MRRQLILGGLLFALVAPARGQSAQCEVRYVSADHVYLDAGTLRGVSLGDHPRVHRDGKEIAELEVVFVADHSASCRVVVATGEILSGDVVTYVPEVTEEPPAPAPPPAPERMRASIRTRQVATSEANAGVDMSGYLGLAWDHTSEELDVGLSSDLVTLPFRVLVRGLGGGRELRARGRLRHLTRQGYTASVPGQEWRNRVLEIALVQDDPRRNWNYAIGRVGSRLVAAAGPFDGLRADVRVSGPLRVGLFGGFAPRWSDLGFATDDRLVGFTAHIDGRTARGRALDVVLSAVGRYRRSAISREYVSITTSWRNASGLSLLQAAEVDVNRGWRHEATGTRLALSSLALTGRWRASRQVALSLGWDDRNPVRTWESQALPDSLFRDAGRRGLGAGVTWRPAPGKTFDLRGSLRRDDASATTVYSWSSRIYAVNLPTRGLDLDLALRGFDGPYLSGWSPSLGLARRSRGGLDVRVAAGYYGYRGIDGAGGRSSSWGEVGVDWSLTAGWSLGAEVHRDWGRDIAGDRWLLQWRRRF